MTVTLPTPQLVAPQRETAYPTVFSPVRIGHLLVKNRISTAPAAPRLATADGHATPELIEWSRSLARGGAGVVTIGFSTVTPRTPDEAHVLNLGDDSVLPGLAALADAIHGAGSVASIELAALAFDPTLPPGVSVVDAMTVEQIRAWVDLFADAAERAAFAGFDMVMVHGGHGALVSNFFSPMINHREDSYGGDVAGRARFAVELLDAIRAKVGRRLAIEFRISAEELVQGGVMLPETIELARIIEDRIDLLHVSAGFLMRDDLLPYTTQPTYLPRASLVHYAAQIKEAGLRVPIATVGSLDLDTAEAVLSRGEADVCAMIRTVIADPCAVDNARRGRPEDTRPCIRCVLCLDRTHGMRPLRVACAVNPRAGREAELRTVPAVAPVSKKVVVVGGGPAGMEAARAAADRGHDVVLFEAGTQLGGALNLAVSPDFKADLRAYLAWAVRSTTAHPRIDVRLATPATPERVQAEQPDAVVVAVGAEPALPPVPGLDVSGAVWVGDVESGRVQAGDRVVVAGGGLTGCETALDLARKGKQVTIVEMLPEPEMTRVSPVAMTAMLALLREAGVTVLSGHRLVAVREGLVAVQDLAKARDARGEGAGDGDGDADTAAVREIGFDTLVASLGVRPRDAEARRFAGVADDIRMIGDCTTSRGSLFTATRTGFDVGLAL